VLKYLLIKRLNYLGRALKPLCRDLSEVFDRDFPGKPPYVFNFTGEVDNSTLYPSVGTKAKIIKYGESVEIVYQGTNIGNAENHPMHLHGFSFYLVGTGYGNWDNVTSPKTYNLVDPPEVNTIGVPKNGWAVIRFVAANPGILSLSLLTSYIYIYIYIYRL
jgi:laccase